MTQPGSIGESRITSLIIDSLSSIPLFDELDAAALRNVARHMHIIEVEPGEMVFEEGEAGDYVCFVVSGTLSVIKESASGDQAEITTLSKGKSIGEMAVIDEFPRSATVIASSQSTLITLNRLNFQLLLDKHPKAGIPILKGIARLVSMNLRRTSGRLADMMLPLV